MTSVREGVRATLAVAVVASLACGGGSRARSEMRDMPHTPVPAAIESALVRVVHTVPGGKPLDVFAGEQIAFHDVKYKTVTEYRPLGAERTALRLRRAGEDTSRPLLEDGASFSAHEHYTLVVMSGSDGKRLQLEILNDDVDPPSTGKARIRVVNALPQGTRLKVLLGGRKQPLASGVEARAVTSYSEVDPLSGTLELRDESLKRTLAKLPDWHLDPGKSYTLYVLGRSSGNPGVEPLIIQDEVMSATGG